MEVSAVDPKLGGIFYQLEQDQVRHPKFVRETDCMRCHSGPRTMGVPGHIMRSVGHGHGGRTAGAEPRCRRSIIARRWPIAGRAGS